MNSVIKEKKKTRSNVAPYRIHHVAVNVKDLQRSIEFYEKLIGLYLTDRDEHSAKLKIGEADLTLFQLPSDAEPCDKPDGEHASSLNHIAFEIHPSMFETYHKRLIDHDIKITFGPVKRRHGHALYFLDPDGNKIELFYSNTARNGA